MKRKFILYVQTSDAPERQYAPLVLAQTAKAMDVDAVVYYLGMGLKVLIPGAAEKLQVGSFPAVIQMITQAQNLGVTFYACEASKQLLGLDKVELIAGVKVVGAGTLNDLALDADATMWF